MGCLRLSYLSEDRALNEAPIFHLTLLDNSGIPQKNRLDSDPFGTAQEGRKGGATDYRYGFQGQEMDDEVKGEGNSYTTEYRMLDPRLGRWMSIDPRADKYAFSSPYVAYGNNPLLFVDNDGDTIRVHGTINQQWEAVGFLQTLTNDKLTLKDGIVMIDQVGTANSDMKLSVGTELIKELIEHKRDVNIFQNSENVKQANLYDDPDSFEQTFAEDIYNGIGSDTRVNIDLTKANETKLLIENPESKKIVWKKVARESSLAHELIHAYYMMNGQRVRDDVEIQYQYTNEKGILMNATQKKEETDTTGLTGDRKYTENKIRKEHKWGKRVKY